MWTWDQRISRAERRGVYAAAMGQVGANNKYCHITHKVCIELPRTVEDALDIDHKMGTELWDKTIRKYMKKIRIVFEKLDCVTPEQIKLVRSNLGISID